MARDLTGRARYHGDMRRLFVAIRPPAPIRALLLDAMGGIGGARWQSDDQLHLTLRFIGEVDRHLAGDIHAALDRAYAGERFVRVMPLNDPQTLADGYFDVQACNDSNRVELFVFGRDGQIMLISRLDNLGKGASGAAVQSMNLHLGVDEGLGLA